MKKGIDPSIVKRFTEFQVVFAQSFPPDGIPDPYKYEDLAAFREALTLVYTLYMENPESVKREVSLLLDEFDAAHAMTMLSNPVI
jgi:hypothetical protein